MAGDEQWVAMLLPGEIRDLSSEQLISRIREIRETRGDNLAILAHHYQQDEIVEQADHRGDSLALSRKAASLEEAGFIVFCGVEFMVETAAILARPGQEVIFPAPNAGCPLADTADPADVERAWKEMAERINVRRVIPITYVNSSSEIKAFCGENEGVVCTSSNAARVIQWALERGERFLFMPDENLGRNSCNALEIPREKTVVWDPAIPGGGCETEDLEGAKAILWKGYCHVHTNFTLQQVKMARENFPGCKIIVHPECVEEVVDASDASGSTAQILEYVEEAEPGSTIVVGTESHFVNRLAREYPDLTVLELSHSECPDMSRVNLRNLYWVLKNLGNVNVVRMDERIKKAARLALERMLSIS